MAGIILIWTDKWYGESLLASEAKVISADSLADVSLQGKAVSVTGILQSDPAGAHVGPYFIEDFKNIRDKDLLAPAATSGRMVTVMGKLNGAHISAYIDDNYNSDCPSILYGPAGQEGCKLFLMFDNNSFTSRESYILYQYGIDHMFEGILIIGGFSIMLFGFLVLAFSLKGFLVRKIGSVDKVFIAFGLSYIATAIIGNISKSIHIAVSVFSMDVIFAFIIVFAFTLRNIDYKHRQTNK
jgi:hypothetical protein